MKLNSIPAHVSSPHSNLKPEELKTSLLSRATSLSQTALKVLLCKRDKLTLEQRSIEDEIAKYDERIKNIKDDVELQLETILESCNEAYPGGILQESHDKSACGSNKRKLCEPLPCTKSMCQKLDDICLENNWVLPSYHVSLSDGGFEAEVWIKETYFAHTICGDEKCDAEEARESAAACLLTRLHHNRTTANDVLTVDHLRSPSPMKVLKPSIFGETSEKDPLPSENQTSLPLPIANLELTAKMYKSLRKLRSNIVKESPDGVTAYHIFSDPTLHKISIKIPRNKKELLEIGGLGKAKVSKYGDRLLEAIETTINEYYATNKQSLKDMNSR
ncbi:uncharacterized protein LOC108861213 [Raphanus sativus]|uniref:Uncharacterized protein LOC108861213 n=1 Tax=Raphanus sativus TaxID=3726 RepID=A0A9W3DSV7_RAPSA|nr:uncharacterized protein LOC108861213 [Raphanus sativus]